MSLAFKNLARGQNFIVLFEGEYIKAEKMLHLEFCAAGQFELRVLVWTVNTEMNLFLKQKCFQHRCSSVNTAVEGVVLYHR